MNPPAGTSFEVTVNGSPTPTLQWERSTDGGTSWSLISGATSGTLTLGSTTTTMDGYRYRCVATNSLGTVTSSSAPLTIAIGPASAALPTGDLISTSGQIVMTGTSGPGSPTPVIDRLPVKPRAEFERALRRYPDVEAVVIGPRGTPSFLRGDFGRVASSGAAATLADLESELSAIASIFGLTRGNLDFAKSELDNLKYRHFYFDLRLNGLPVVGGMVIIHLNAAGRIYCVNGTVPDETEAPGSSARIGQNEARAVVQRNLVGWRAKNDRLVYFMDSGQRRRLAWETTRDVPGGRRDRDKAYVDAESAEWIEALTSQRHADNRRVNSAFDPVTNLVYSYYLQITDHTANPVTVQDFSYRLQGLTPLRSEGGPAAPANQSAVNDAYGHLGTTYNYFSSKFGLDGMDRSGGPVYTMVNTQWNFRNITSTGTANTYTGYQGWYIGWTNPTENSIYLGTGTAFTTTGYTTGNLATSMAAALDVVAHEYMHGVSANREIGRLGYIQGENSALNEAVSDIFGSMVERYANGGVIHTNNTWLMGHTLTTPIRAINNPRSISTTAADFYPDMVVNASSHTNSTVVSLAFKLAVTGGAHPTPAGKTTMNVPALGADKAEQIFYRALTLAPVGCDFRNFKAATATAASDLAASLGANARDLEAQVQFAFDAVGVPYRNSNARAINISTRAAVGAYPMIAGFVVSGSGSKDFLLRGVGPTLSSLGVVGANPDPYVSLTNSAGTELVANDDWGLASNASSIATAATGVGAFELPSGSKDAAILRSFSGGAYTMTVTGVNGASGEALAEAYDTAPLTSPRVVNLSTRAFVSSANQMTTGFVIDQGVEGFTSKKVLIRAVGPGLGQFGVSPILNNPVLTLQWKSSSGTAYTIYTNTGWETNWNVFAVEDAATAVGAFPLSSGSGDSALLVSLPPGTYTAVVNDLYSGSGNALLEVYDVP